MGWGERERERGGVSFFRSFILGTIGIGLESYPTQFALLEWFGGVQPFLKPWAFLFRHRKLLFSSLSRISTDLQVHQHSDSTSSLLLTPSEWLCFLAMQSPNNSSAYPPTKHRCLSGVLSLEILGVQKHENKKTCCSSRGTHTHTQSSKKDFRPLRAACIQDQPALILTAKLFIFQSVPVTFPLSLVQARRWRRSKKK